MFFLFILNCQAETDFSRIVNEVDPGHTGYISFDAFLNFMTRDNVDEATEEQLIQSFKTLGGDKVSLVSTEYIT